MLKKLLSILDMDTKENIKKIRKTVIAFFIIPLLIIHFLFKWNSGIELIQAEWSAGDILNYISSFYNLLFAVVLGFITIKLTQTANNTNERLLALEEKRQVSEKVKNEPFFNLDYEEMQKINDFKLDGNIVFVLQNLSPNNLVKQLTFGYVGAEFYEKGNLTKYESYKSLNCGAVAPLGKVMVTFPLSEFKMEKKEAMSSEQMNGDVIISFIIVALNEYKEEKDLRYKIYIKNKQIMRYELLG